MNQVVATGRRLLRQAGVVESHSRLEREQSPLRMRIVPIVSVMFGSMVTALPFFFDSPMLPPVGFLILLGWRLMRPGIWPAWIGLPLGLFDDLFSGQPFGSAGLIWSLALLIMEAVDSRAHWRDYWQDWLIASALTILALLVGLGFSGLAHRAPEAEILVPQMLLSVMTYPLAVRLCARLDAWRLAT